ncbi:28S ribosomal protein S5, mitochondrial [Habropoda laboriosa]|uniref:Small ribosomal subunit protein uS5m n=1 Tax=Habropoda laboriosa TaxID=597456 RepID=A0A0L7R1T1_9HYME|nr:PREDICTED: 28S ribosomal protein S5, mitochondrial [Habropoda laboriosa]KOC64746.1 28S ribosomal protein S5, mitochondrial [Habropoda laboriosa]
MAYRIFRTCKAITNCTISTSIKNNAIPVDLLVPQTLQIQNARNTNFFMRRSAAQLWKAVTSVSNAGKRRGRGKNLPKVKDLNEGQKLGWGKIPIMFPGLNINIMQGKTVVTQRRLSEEEQESRQLNVAKHVGTSMLFKKFKTPALKRGWTGGHLGGKKIGPPKPIDDDKFDGFETWMLYSKTVNVMTSIMGRSKRVRCMVITGNGNGLAGFVMITGKDLRSTIYTAKSRAGQRLIHVERYNNHTVLHDFYTQFGRTKIFVKQKHKGYGLKCHRAIQACCEAIGITDLYAKLEGSSNTGNIVKAFFVGLLQQKTHEDMAKEKKLHLVEIRKENNYFPTVLASPPVVRDRSEIPPNEDLDFQQYVMKGKVPYWRKKPPPFYAKLPSWQVHLRKEERHRGQDDVVLRLRAEYGDLCSFLAEKYPEAKAPKWRKHDKKNEEDSEQ